MKFCKLKNRGNQVFAFRFDGVNYQIPPGGTVPLPEHIAQHGYKKSAFAVDKYSNLGTHQCAIEGVHEEAPLKPEEEAKVGEHLDMEVVGKVEGRKMKKHAFTNRAETSDLGT